jgi:hypothetical protein
MQVRISVAWNCRFATFIIIVVVGRTCYLGANFAYLHLSDITSKFCIVAVYILYRICRKGNNVIILQRYTV